MGAQAAPRGDGAPRRRMSSHPSTIHLVRIHGWRLVRASLCDPSNHVPTLLPPFIVCSRGPRGIAGPRGYGPFYVYYTYKYFGLPPGGPRAGRRWGGASCPPVLYYFRMLVPPWFLDLLQAVFLKGRSSLQ